MGESFWQKDSLITHILFELWLIMLFRPVANFAQQSLAVNGIVKSGSDVIPLFLLDNLLMVHTVQLEILRFLVKMKQRRKSNAISLVLMC